MIPATAHFVWIGREFSWLSWAAIASAASRGGFERVLLYHTDDLEHAPEFRAVKELERVQVVRLDPIATVEGFGGARLVDRYRRLRTPSAQSNVLRLGLLEREGGVYLDLDTLTVRDMTPLRKHVAFFCGTERVAFSSGVRRSKNPLLWARAQGLSAVRDLVRRSNDGVRWFRRIERYYALGANNAVLGATPGAAFLHELRERMLALSADESRRRFALGTTLLQSALAEAPPTNGVVHEPAVFYPLGPEISRHWFRAKSRVRLEEVVSPETHVVHWYASVANRRITPLVNWGWVERQHPTQLLGQLLRKLLRMHAGIS